MAGKGKAVGTLVKWGVKYGPHVIVIAQQAREPALAAAQKALDKQKAKRRAVEHAATVVDGSVLKAYDPHGADSSDPVWVVFSGEEPMASHPATATPLIELVAKSDLATRVRPHDLPSARERARRAAAKATRRDH